MPHNNSTYPTEWLRIAEKDLKRVSHALRADDPEMAGFYLQQSVEKIFKAFLLSHNWRLRRIHDLSALLDEIISFFPEGEEYREVCQRISAYYFLERYPGMSIAAISINDVKQSLTEISGLLETLKFKLQ